MHLYTVTPAASVALPAGTAKTILHVRTGATTPLVVGELGISFDGTTSTDQPVLVELLRQSANGTFGDDALAESPQSTKSDAADATGHADASAEPTAGAILRRWYVRPDGGLFVATFGEVEWISAPAAAAIGLRCTAAAAVNAEPYFVLGEL